eukprot:CAMPEP_0180736608 /NCGR_PEP_ID=MMETSP1038_2-20121128/23855_1 /TAXON_ID=632150 /ORGANISM="Azadinium spinosum, Strain 3D9" /LENGTH=100 /DNA_ID=CAMNT_0022769669 /DNA_START=793 /DNA_END=1091 /DNA_ORIENTATION=+
MVHIIGRGKAIASRILRQRPAAILSCGAVIHKVDASVGHGDAALQTLEAANQHHTVRPPACVVDEEVVPARLWLEAASLLDPILAVRGSPSKSTRRLRHV